MDIQITKTGGKIDITSPYSADFVAAVKRIGGKWQPSTKTWRVDERDEAHLNELLAKHYGWIPEGEGELVTFRVTLTYKNAEGKIFSVANRDLVSRWHRDHSPLLADGVVIVDGKFPARRGSMRFPLLFDYGDDPVTIEVRDFPKAALEAAGIEYELVSTSIDPEALEAEKARLLARIAEIDALLA